MLIKLHKLAKTTPSMRRYIWNEININKRTIVSLAKELNLSIPTVNKWSKRDIENNPEEVYDRSHARHNLLLNPKEEEIIKYCRANIGLSIRDIAIVLHKLFDDINIKNNRIICYSRTSIHKCIKRHNLKTPLEVLKEYNKEHNNSNNKFDKKPGFIHIDFKYLPVIKELNPKYNIINTNNTNNNTKKYIRTRSYMFSAIDRYSRYVYTEVLEDKSINNVVNFLKNFINDFELKTYNSDTKESMPINVILTDNGGEFTDRYAVDSKLKKELNIKPNKPNHPFDLVCKEHNIEHRLIKPYHPQTNGMIERFNGRVSKALKEYRIFKGEFKRKEDLFNFIIDTTKKYNNANLQCLNYKTPLDMLKEYKECREDKEDKECKKYIDNNKEDKENIKKECINNIDNGKEDKKELSLSKNNQKRLNT